MKGLGNLVNIELCENAIRLNQGDIVRAIKFVQGHIENEQVCHFVRFW